MTKTARQLLVAMGLIASGLTGSNPAFGAEPERPAIRILVVNHLGRPRQDILVRAQAEVTRIYAAAGVRLVWTDPSRTLPYLTIMIDSEQHFGTPRGAADAMGAAPAADEGNGRLAYAFYNHIEASSQHYGTDVAKVLGSVIAHEIGHLLLGRRAHAIAGIMKATWKSPDMILIANSLLGFTNEQTRLIRSTVAEMNASHKEAVSP